MKNYSATSLFFGTILGIVLVSCEKDVPATNNASEIRLTVVSGMAMTSQKNGDPYIRPETTSISKKTPLPILWPDTTKTR